MNHSKVIEPMKELQGWRFLLLWVWLMAVTVVPLGIAWIMRG
jgi:uncharacterized membrane protein